MLIEFYYIYIQMSIYFSIYINKKDFIFNVFNVLVNIYCYYSKTHRLGIKPNCVLQLFLQFAVQAP